jgi:hypothetical protein
MSLEFGPADPSLKTTVPAQFVLLPSTLNPTAYSSVFLGKIIIRALQLTSKYPVSYGILWLVVTFKKPAIRPYLKPDELSPQYHANFLKHHFKISIPSTLRSSMRPLTVMLRDQVSSHLSRALCIFRLFRPFLILSSAVKRHHRHS